MCYTNLSKSHLRNKLPASRTVILSNIVKNEADTYTPDIDLDITIKPLNENNCISHSNKIQDDEIKSTIEPVKYNPVIDPISSINLKQILRLQTHIYIAPFSTCKGFLEYLLCTNDKKNDIIQFPYIEIPDKTKSLLNYLNEYIKNLFKEIAATNYKIKGVITHNNCCFIFIQFFQPLNFCIHSSNYSISLLDEILNKRSLFNTPIDHNIISLFYSHKSLCYTFTNDNIVSEQPTMSSNTFRHFIHNTIEFYL